MNNAVIVTYDLVTGKVASVIKIHTSSTKCSGEVGMVQTFVEGTIGYMLHAPNAKN